MNELLFIDIEGTSVNPHYAEILTISASRKSQDLELIDEIELCLKPDTWGIHADEAQEIHGISKRRAMRFPNKLKGLNQLMDWISIGSTMVCHASPNTEFGFQHYDRAILFMACIYENMEHEFLRKIRNVESTLTIAKRLDKEGIIDIPKITKVNVNGVSRTFKSFSLDNLCNYYNIKLNHHEARSDRIACEQLYGIFREEKRRFSNRFLQEQDRGTGDQEQISEKRGDDIKDDNDRGHDRSKQTATQLRLL